MNRLGLLVVAALAAVVCVASWASPASAHLVCETEVLAHDGTVRCDSYSNDHGHGSDEPGSGSSSQPPSDEAQWRTFGCSWVRPYEAGYTVELTVLGQIPHEGYDQINADPGAPGFRFLEAGVDYYHVLVHCEYPGAAPGGVIRRFSGPELNQGPDPLVLRAQALAAVSVAEPPVSSNPPHDEPGRFGVVYIPTWFWLDEGYWEPLSATAADPGGALSVTVTATPQLASWDPGDGSDPVLCSDPGVAWRSGLPEDATTCSHTYRSSSGDVAGGAYSLEVAVEWEYSWSVNGEDQGAFGSITVASPFSYAVGEIHALES